MLIQVQLYQDVLQFTIEDNGVRSRQSMMLNARPDLKIKSLGTQLTSDRIAIINQLHSAKARVSTKDLYRTERLAGGTGVIITLSISK